MDEKLRRRLRTLIVIILILINVVILLKNLIKENSVSKNNNSNTQKSETKTQNEIYTETVQNTSKVIDSKIKNMDENKRTQTYFGEYIDAIENKNYAEAYNMLNDEYKNNYFQTLTEFENYAKETYPSGSIVVEYNDFDRKGEVYVLDVNLYSASDTSNKINQTVVIRENGVNDFKISFSKDVRQATSDEE